MFSPIQIAADLPENYERNAAFQFIKNVPTNRSESKVLNSKIGDYYTIARKERGTENWYLRSISDENSRSFEIDLSFLWEGKKYEATIYADSKDKIKLAAGGGQAIAFKTIN